MLIFSKRAPSSEKRILMIFLFIRTSVLISLWSLSAYMLTTSLSPSTNLISYVPKELALLWTYHCAVQAFFFWWWRFSAAFLTISVLGTVRYFGVRHYSVSPYFDSCDNINCGHSLNIGSIFLMQNPSGSLLQKSECFIIFDFFVSCKPTNWYSMLFWINFDLCLATVNDFKVLKASSCMNKNWTFLCKTRITWVTDLINIRYIKIYESIFIFIKMSTHFGSCSYSWY